MSGHGNSFLDLPVSVRNKIYLLTDLCRLCPIDLVAEKELLRDDYVHILRDCADSRRFLGGERGEYCTYVNYHWILRGPTYRIEKFTCLGPPLALSLLLVSRAVYKETVSVLYSRNKFKLRPLTPDILAPLTRIGRNAVSNLTSLQIIWDHPVSLGVDYSKARGEALVEACKSTCLFLSQSIPPHQLSFALHCSTSDRPAALRIGEALMSLPTVKNCAISFANLFSGDKRPLARSVCQKLSGLCDDSLSSFQFFKLPGEIRTKILRCTDLVACRNRMQWRDNEVALCYGKLASRILCCMRCNDTLEHCCCITKRSAYSTSCECFAGPTALLRVNRQMRMEATVVLFEYNRFHFSGSLLLTLSFFEGLSSSSLASMRMIDFSISGTQLLSIAYGVAEQEDGDYEWLEKWLGGWLTILDFVQQNLNLERLWLSVRIGDWADDFDLGDSGFTRSTMFAAYRRILNPVQRLKGLARYHVFLEDRQEFYEIEAEAERYVMGDEYDSLADGKVAHNLFEFPHDTEMPKHWYPIWRWR